MSESGIFSVGKVEVEGLGIHVRYRVRNFDPFEDTKPLLLVADDQEVVAGTTQEHNRPESEGTVLRIPLQHAHDTDSTAKYPTTDTPSTTSTLPSATSVQDQAHGSFDKTGLMVWPASLLLSRFIAKALGGYSKRLHSLFSNIFGYIPNPPGHDISNNSNENDEGKYGHPPRPDFDAGNALAEENNKLRARRGNQVGSNPTDKSVHAYCSCLQQRGGPANSVKRSREYGHGADPTPNLAGGRMEPMRKVDAAPTLQRLSAAPSCPSCSLECAIPLPHVSKGNTRATALELGAGTGVCGLTAAIAIGCPVLLTDRRCDVLENLRANVVLNGLEDRVQVVRLAWGRPGDSALSREIENEAPFELILASDTVYPGKPWTDAEAFFGLVTQLLDRQNGVLLFAYVPRAPSIATENMLRCAYQAGLRGVRLDEEWECCKDEQNSIRERATKELREDCSTYYVNDLCRRGRTDGGTTTTSLRSEEGGDANRTQVVESAGIAGDCMASSCDQFYEKWSTNELQDVQGNCTGREGQCSQDLKNREAALRNHLRQSNMYLTNSSRSDTGGNDGNAFNAEGTAGANHYGKESVAARSQKVTPVLLAFRMSTDITRIHGERRTATGIDGRTGSTSSDELQQQWATEWRGMFPDVHFKFAQTETEATVSTASLSGTSGSEHGDEQARDGRIFGIIRQGGHVDMNDDTGCSWEELWEVEGE